MRFVKLTNASHQDITQVLERRHSHSNESSELCEFKMVRRSLKARVHVKVASESDWAMTRLGSNLTKKALPNWRFQSRLAWR